MLAKLLQKTMEEQKMKVSERFLEYVKIDTQSAYAPVSFPSTEKQRDLAKLLKQQLDEMGLVDVYISDNCCLYGKLPANYEGCEAPVVGLATTWIQHRKNLEQILNQES